MYFFVIQGAFLSQSLTGKDFITHFRDLSIFAYLVSKKKYHKQIHKTLCSMFMRIAIHRSFILQVYKTFHINQTSYYRYVKTFFQASHIEAKFSHHAHHMNKELKNK